MGEDVVTWTLVLTDPKKCERKISG